MALKGSTNEEKIWNYLIEKNLSKAGCAGLMGNLYAESGLQSTNLQNTSEKKFGLTDASYTAAVDNGSYRYGSYKTAADSFARDSAGYGLAQWTYWSRKQGLYNAAKKANKSVGDLEVQLDYLFEELSTSFKSVLTVLKTATSIKIASDNVLLKFEKPLDQSNAAKEKRAAYGQKYYDKYAAVKQTVQSDATEKKTEATGLASNEDAVRQKLVDIAVSYYGCKEANGSHKKIIDIYNNHKPLANGYKVKYTDAWCSTYASAMAILAGYTDIIPTECGCERHINLFKKIGSWQESDAYKPKPGDYIFYDWQDGTNYAYTDNVGHADHVGIVVSVSGTSIKVIEGNMSDAVGYRTLQTNGRYIRGYGVPNYALKIGKTEYKGNAQPEPQKPQTGGEKTYVVNRGDSLWAIAQRTLGNGERWKEIQKLNDLGSTVIRVGQILKIPQK